VSYTANVEDISLQIVYSDVAISDIATGTASAIYEVTDVGRGDEI